MLCLSLDFFNVSMMLPKAKYSPKEEELYIAHLKAAWISQHSFCLFVSNSRCCSHPLLGILDSAVLSGNLTKNCDYRRSLAYRNVCGMQKQ